MTAWDNPFHVGAPSAEDRADAGLAKCAVCAEWRDETEGEPLDDGIVCDGCMKEPVACETCLRTFARSEFVGGGAISVNCGACDHARDMERQ